MVRAWGVEPLIFGNSQEDRWSFGAGLELLCEGFLGDLTLTGFRGLTWGP